MWLVLQVNRSVTSIDLAGNEIGDEGAKHLGSGLAVRLVVIVPFVVAVGCAPVVYLPPLYPHLTLYHLLYSPTPILFLVLYPPSFHFTISFILRTILPCVVSFASSIICHLYSLLSPVLALYPLSPPVLLYAHPLLCHLL